MKKEAIHRIHVALNLLAEGSRLTAEELVDIAPDNHDLTRIALIMRCNEEALTTIETLERFL